MKRADVAALMAVLITRDQREFTYERVMDQVQTWFNYADERFPESNPKATKQRTKRRA